MKVCHKIIFYTYQLTVISSNPVGQVNMW